MTIMTKFLIAGLGGAAAAVAVPAAAQYGYGYGGSQFAAQRCAAAVDSRRNIEVISVTSVNPNRRFIRVRGIATNVRRLGYYDPYGSRYYGALGSRFAANVTFRCDVDYRGRIRDIDINRR